MTAADFLRFVIIVGLGALAFVTFLVAGTIIVLMLLDSWTCGACSHFPAGLYVLGILGILFIISISNEASETPKRWGPWIEANRAVLIVGLLSFITLLIVMNSRWWL